MHACGRLRRCSSLGRQMYARTGTIGQVHLLYLIISQISLCVSTFLGESSDVEDSCKASSSSTYVTSYLRSPPGPQLFAIFINDLAIPDCVSLSLCYPFANDTKCLKVISNQTDIATKSTT